MKKLVLISVLFAALSAAIAQSPQGMSYQAIVRNGSGEVLANQNVSLRITILQGSISGTSVYVEIHAVVSNPFGLVNLSVGSGTVVTGVFANIDWINGPYFVKLELDAAGGSNYTDMGSSQLLSVPYSFFAQKAGNVQVGQNFGDMMYWNGGDWLMIPAGQNGQTMTCCNGVPTWGFCPYLPIANTPVIITNSYPTSTVSSGISITAGATPVTAKGVCWNTTGSPVITDFHTSDGSGSGVFTSTLTGLSMNTIVLCQGLCNKFSRYFIQ